MAAFDVVDPFKGMTYSQVLESLSSEKRKLYVDVIPPLLKVPGTGKASWDVWQGKYVV